VGHPVYIMLHLWFHKVRHYCRRYQWSVVGSRGKLAIITAL